MYTFFCITYKSLYYTFYLLFVQVFNFAEKFKVLQLAAEEWSKAQARIPKQMRTFEESQKSKKTVASMIERKGGDEKDNKKKGKQRVKCHYYVIICGCRDNIRSLS